MYLNRFVKEREYGAIQSATFVRRCGVPDWSGWLPDDNRSGGAVLDLLIHDIDQALWLFGVPDRVAAKQLGSMDAVTATLIYPDGPEVRIQGGWFAAGSALSMTFQVRAERAELELAPTGLTVSNHEGQRNEIAVTGGDAYAAELAYFVECCRRNSKPERCMPEDSCRAVKLALLLKQSRAQGGDQLKCVL
jgi:predicted dehydrogenase